SSSVTAPRPTNRPPGDTHGLTRTDWPLLGQVRDPDEARAAAAMERVVRRYWPAVFAFIRKSGRDVHEASDLPQAYITEVVLSRGLIASADPARGRFRHFLQRSLRNFLHEPHRKNHRLKRMPSSQRIVSIDQLSPDGAQVPAAPSGQSADEAFDAAW